MWQDDLLLMLDDHHALAGHPKVGASWEGFALEQVLRLTRRPEAYYWSVHSGPELNLLLMHNGRRYGVEFKYTETPKITRSMRSAMKLLKLERLWVVTPGEVCCPVAEQIDICGLAGSQNNWLDLA